MTRRDFLIGVAGALATGRTLLGAAKAGGARLGLCSFSCHQQWKAVQNKEPGVQFQDALSFYRYGRSLGADGVQTSLRSRDPMVARSIREAIEHDGGYYEAELRLPKTEADVEEFAEEVKLAKAAGATVGRSVCMGGRRYEVFKTRDEFDAFAAQSRKSLQLAEPIVRRERLKLAIENHKDFTTDELIPLILQISSEWVGVLVDTGNNIALLESPERVAERLAPWAFSVHLKDMAVQPSDEGFLLSEVALGTGALDLKRMTTALVRQNPRIVLNLEMATRDPLRIPCRRDGYFATFPEQRKAVEPMLSWVQSHPLRQSPPATSGKETAQILRDEEANNRRSLEWMTANV
jgi:sugar phosphate isomerase/epimerase